MADQFNVIKTILLNIEDKLTQQDNQYRRANRKLHGAVVELTESVQGCTNSDKNFVNTGSFTILIINILLKVTVHIFSVFRLL